MPPPTVPSAPANRSEPPRRRTTSGRCAPSCATASSGAGSRVGSTEWQREDVSVPGTGRVLARDAVCRLHVPVNKTAAAFTKPVDYVVGEAIVAWEGARPPQASALDPKTGELVQFLFSCHNR